ncbi:transposase [Microbacterium sp. Clip185]|uniref:transposase n=1 Tax=Microbacterium sp. Clip185 TaxID=3025663 RepID=UPI0023668699|nr:transposase [Microbacterium sp. Clip185]WDG16989.1 transposase [Microbacterium sp. Clip185]
MAAASGNPVDEVAVALYRLPPDAFTAARDERAATADAADAARIKALRKPVVAAWAVNLLVADGQLVEAIELAAALREAQEDLDAAELRRLGTQRRQLVASLAKRAAALAAEAGHPLADSAREAVAQTINAAVMDARAAAAVLTGRLRKPLDAGALDDLDAAEVVAGSPLGETAARPASDPDELAVRRARKAAERAARDAERTATAVERERVAAEVAERKAREHADLLHERIAEVRAQLERLVSDADAADAELAHRERRLREAASAAKAAANEAQRARDAVPD